MVLAGFIYPLISQKVCRPYVVDWELQLSTCCSPTASICNDEVCEETSKKKVQINQSVK